MPDRPLSARGLIDKASGDGLEIVQIADNLPAEKLPQSELEDLLKHADERKVSIETGGRGLIPEHVMKCLQTADQLKSPILRMVIDAKDFAICRVSHKMGLIIEGRPAGKGILPLRLESHTG